MQLSLGPGINPKTVAKWHERATVEDMKTGPGREKLAMPRVFAPTSEVQQYTPGVKIGEPSGCRPASNGF